ncbi:hypothetical protein [Chamaesiphon sp. OTE_8_metabat_110]|uniref:hypothetical protein n=1 Tax=Chamaesiphon sp. OTE_8_metabat_110 TaxID=2964696 RepID=UPI00286AEE23|nr:hypothetical protein [Chamaesiphon sp. OTE_8_metabat_110]
MAQFWIAVFFILLASAQLVQSIKAIDLPFPVYLILGMVLAVAANPRSRLAFIPTQQVTIQEIATPDPTIAAAVPLISTPEFHNVAPAQLDALEPKPKRTKTAPKSLPATPKPPNALEAIEPKPKRARKTTAKSPQV